MTDTKDPYSIPGTAIGASSADKIKAKAVIITTPTFYTSLKELGASVVNSANWHLSAITDDNRSPKYAADVNASYYGNGSLSILDRIGKFVFAKNTNEANQAAFKIDQGDSGFYSSMANTTLGSLAIDTVDGYILNPVCSIFPSTNFTPTKPWVKKLFPTLSNKNLVMITIMEAVQALLFQALSDLDTESTTIVKTRKDMAQIIIDNQQIEDRLFSKSGNQ